MTTRTRFPRATVGILALTLGAGLGIAGTYPAFADSPGSSAGGDSLAESTTAGVLQEACPDLVSLEAKDITDTSFTVEWVVADGVTYDHFTTDGIGGTITRLGPDVRSFDVTNAVPGAYFNMAVYAYCADGSSSSAYLSFNTTGPRGSANSTNVGSGSAAAVSASDASGTAAGVGSDTGDSNGATAASASNGDASVGGSNADASIGGTSDASGAAGSEGAAAAAGVRVAGAIEPTAATTSTLANTGSDLSASLLALGGLLTVGGLATLTVLTAKRRRATQ